MKDYVDFTARYPMALLKASVNENMLLYHITLRYSAIKHLAVWAFILISVRILVAGFES